MTGEQRYEAIVLHTRPMGDAHKIVELLTDHAGRVVAMARNARASKRRFAGALDIFSHVRVRLTFAGHGMPQLQEAVLLEPFLGLRADLQAFERAARMTESVRLLVAEHMVAPGLVSSVAKAFAAMAADQWPAAVTFYAELLAAVGQAPDMRVCVACGCSGLVPATLDVHRQGMRCVGCSSGATGSTRSLLALTHQWVEPLTATEAEVTEKMAMAWIEAQTGKVMRSRRGMGAAAPMVG